MSVSDKHEQEIQKQIEFNARLTSPDTINVNPDLSFEQKQNLKVLKFCDAFYWTSARYRDYATAQTLNRAI